MKPILNLALIFSIGFCYAQSEKKASGIKTNLIPFKSCEDGTKRAIKDAERKLYKSYTYGLIARTAEEWKFSEFYKTYMASTYGISIIDGGCIVTAESKCYTKKMKELIVVEFGTNIFERTREEAKKIYNKSD